MTPEREAEIREALKMIDFAGDDQRPSWAVDLLAEIDRLRAELAKVRAEREWQPIATAPKDGIQVLIMGRLREYILVETAWWKQTDLGSQGWFCRDGWYCGDPTHWMPLSPVPSEARS